MIELNPQTIDRLLELGGREAKPFNTTNGDPLVLVPSGMKVESLANYSPPSRIRRRVTLLESDSFIEYVNRFKNDDSLIFANLTEQSATLTAVLDYHGPKDARYCDHIAFFSTIPTPEWKVWLEANRKAMGQVDFATWLEDNLSLFVKPEGIEAPSGAELLELIRTLHGHQNARFNTSLRLDNGAFSVAYEEDVSVRGTSTQRTDAIELPKEIVAGIKVFQGSVAYEVRARFKSRITERKLMLYFETINLPNIIRDAILGIVKQVGEKTSIIPLLGNP